MKNILKRLKIKQPITSAPPPVIQTKRFVSDKLNFVVKREMADIRPMWMRYSSKE